MYDDTLRDELEKLLEVMSFEDLLEENEMEILDILEILYRGGHLSLPDWRPL